MVSPVVTSEGVPVSLTATVNTVGTNAHTMGGAVTFTFESFTTTGAIDLSWELGTVPLSGASATTAQATLTTAVPPGLVKPGNQWVDLIAVYTGDANHVGSSSPKVGLEFEPIQFTISPVTATVQPGGTQTFTTSGGIQPIEWGIDFDTTRGRPSSGTGYGYAAASLGDGGVSNTLTAGPKPGYVQVVALDKAYAEVLAYVQVGVTDAGPAPWAADGGLYVDAGAVPPLYDAGKTVDASVGKDAAVVKDASVAKDVGTPGHDASPPQKDATAPTKDAGKEKHDGAEEDAGSASTSSSGCSCGVAGEHPSSRTAPLGAVACMALGLSALVRRRRPNKR